VTTMIDRFFGVHQFLIRGGLLPRMTRSECFLYLALMYESERCSTRELVRSDADITRLSGVSARALRDARIRLQEYGLIRYQVQAGRAHRYVICNPTSGEAYPGDPKERIRYVRRAAPLTGQDRTPKPEERTAAPSPRGSARKPASSSPGAADKSRAPEVPVHGLPLTFK
jgi:hypothetical protein